MAHYISFDRISSYQLMWILIMFDLPTETKKQRKAATDFRKSLIADGFTMFQFSIYVRNCASRENTDVHVKRIKNSLPEEGKVCIITITERQFREIILLKGKEDTTHPGCYTTRIILKSKRRTNTSKTRISIKKLPITRSFYNPINHCKCLYIRQIQILRCDL